MKYKIIYNVFIVSRISNHELVYNCTLGMSFPLKYMENADFS